MARPILDPNYWKERIERGKYPHHAIYVCPLDRWERIEKKHGEILKRTIKPSDSIFDAGCGWGRLLTLLPDEWGGHYVGVDLSPDFVKKACQTFPLYSFYKLDLRDLSGITSQFDWAVLISIRPMVIRELGHDVWDQLEKEIRRVAKKLLYLEYDENCGGFIE